MKIILSRNSIRLFMKTSNDLISILLSSYNSEKTIRNSIKSILKQNYSNFELLIIDDCSTDQTHKIIEKCASEDNRIKIYKNNENIGLTRSLNKLLKVAKGSFIGRQDADDISLPNRFSYQLEYIKKTKVKIVTARAIIKNSNKKIPRYSYLLPNSFVMKYKNPFIHGTLMMERSVIENIGGYDENFYFSQDYKLYKDCYKAGYSISIINKVLYELNMENNISEKNKEAQDYYFKCARGNITPNRIFN